MEVEERKTAMSHDEMQDYWKTLRSFTGEDIPNEINQLMAKIRYPRFLYKYRAVNNNNLDALRSNKLFFSKASSYDDPFDTFLHIDVEKIRQEFDSNYSSPEALAALANGMKETFQNQPGVPQEFIQQVTTVEGLKQLFANGITKQFLSYVLYVLHHDEMEQALYYLLKDRYNEFFGKENTKDGQLYFGSFAAIGESDVFKLLHIVGMDTNLEGELKKLVKERNDYAHANGRLLLTSEEFFLEKIRNFNHCIDRVFALIKHDILQLYASTLNDPDFYDPDIRAYLDPVQQIQEEIVKKYSFSRFELNWCRKFNIKQLESSENYASKKELHIALSKYYKELKSEL